MSGKAIGLMSGTSMDGVDGVLVDFSIPGIPRQLARSSLSMPLPLKTELLALNTPNGRDELNRGMRASIELARCYARVVQELLSKSACPPSAVHVLGCHGQTVRHQPQQGYTVQLGHGAWLAELTGLTVVTDFRSRDMAAGGQGAPLVPAFHSAMFAHPSIPRLILNLGGFSNLTTLIPQHPVRGYDCGPANVLLDAWTQRHLGQPWDEGGLWARSGKMSVALLEFLLAHPFLHRSPPKSTGREDFSLQWIDAIPLSKELLPADVQATLLEFSARCIADCVKNEYRSGLEMFCCGGGVRNTALMERLQALLPGVTLKTTDQLGLDAQWMEATAFAWLAMETLEGRPGNLPEVTGATRRVPLGAIYPAG